jgi:hypothetical protein
MNNQPQSQAKKLRKEINALIKSKKSLASLNVSRFALDGISQAIDELEDAYIAEVNSESESK